MKKLVSGWFGRIIMVIILTIMLGMVGYIIDHAYFQKPLGEGEIGLAADEGYAMPATSEISVVAVETDPLQLDLSSKKEDFSGIVEVVGPDDSVIFTENFALRYQPKSFLPNPDKWETFYLPTPQNGTYRVRITQDSPGKARIFFYQGPFWTRMLMLPFIAVFIVVIISITLAPSKEVESSADKELSEQSQS
ncbi:MAG: hypothetical protein ACQETH_03570 [Candidatus Rifleibacteriota bacterium]